MSLYVELFRANMNKSMCSCLWVFMSVWWLLQYVWKEKRKNRLMQWFFKFLFLKEITSYYITFIHYINIICWSEKYIKSSTYWKTDIQSKFIFLITLWILCNEENMCSAIQINNFSGHLLMSKVMVKGKENTHLQKCVL